MDKLFALLLSDQQSGLAEICKRRSKRCLLIRGEFISEAKVIGMSAGQRRRRRARARIMYHRFVGMLSWAVNSRVRANGTRIFYCSGQL